MGGAKCRKTDLTNDRFEEVKLMIEKLKVTIEIMNKRKRLSVEGRKHTMGKKIKLVKVEKCYEDFGKIFENAEKRRYKYRTK